jgi:hypothetical protein
MVSSIDLSSGGLGGPQRLGQSWLAGQPARRTALARVRSTVLSIGPRVLAAAAALLLACAANAAAADWPRFGYDAARSNYAPAPTGIDAANAGLLQGQRIDLPGAVDSSPLYLGGVDVGGARHDVFIALSIYGRTFAVDADTGAILWSWVPGGIASWEAREQWVSASPVADPGRRFVYVGAPDGAIHKLSLADGSEVLAGWPVPVTVLPEREKLSASLNVTGRYVLASTASFRDHLPYQGHVVAIDRRTGRRVGVFNVLCARRRALIDPRRCRRNFGGVWGRGDPVVEPGSGRLLFSTGNGGLDNRDAFGESLIELSPDARRVLRVWSPRSYRVDAKVDADLGSGSPVLLRRRYVVQASKDGTVRLLDLRRMRRHGRPGRMPGLLGAVRPSPRAPYFSAPAARPSGSTVYLANGAGTVAYSLRGRRPRLVRRWKTRLPGTTPVLAGGLLYVYDHHAGRVNVLNPANGRVLASLPGEPGHWTSPIVADGRVAVGAGDARDHPVAGSLFIYRVAR